MDECKPLPRTTRPVPYSPGETTRGFLHGSRWFPSPRPGPCTRLCATPNWRSDNLCRSKTPTCGRGEGSASITESEDCVACGDHPIAQMCFKEGSKWCKIPFCSNSSSIGCCEPPVPPGSTEGEECAGVLSEGERERESGEEGMTAIGRRRRVQYENTHSGLWKRTKDRPATIA